MRSAERIPIRLPCLAGLMPQRASPDRRGPHTEDQGELHGERPYLWRAAGLARSSGRRRLRGLHKVERLMHVEALRARPRRRGLPKDSDERAVATIAPNVLDRQFSADRPNQKWIADFTYIWTAEGWLYVAAVIDLFSRRVVGWSMKAEMTAQLVTDALIMAIWRRGTGCVAPSLRSGQPVYERAVPHLDGRPRD
jgi:transposase InsO family protein